MTRRDPRASGGGAPCDAAAGTDDATSPTTKERIEAVAVELFADRGYAAVGIRDIAREAGVSVSMASYHFGGKLGILTSIMSDFFAAYTRIVERSLQDAPGVEAKVHSLVRETTRFLKDRQRIFTIVVTELPRLSREAQTFEGSYLRLIRAVMDEWLLPELLPGGPDVVAERRAQNAVASGCIDPEELHRVVGPALLSMIYSTFLFGRGLERAYCFTRDDAFYDEYSETVARLIIAGLREVAGSS